jgi:hypothetical protein
MSEAGGDSIDADAVAQSMAALRGPITACLLAYAAAEVAGLEP